MNDLIDLIAAHPEAAIGALAGIGLTIVWHVIRRIERLVRSIALVALVGGGLAAGGGAAAGSHSAVAQFVSNLLHLR